MLQSINFNPTEVDGRQMKQLLMKSFCRGSRGAVFSKRAPLAAGGKKQGNMDD
jgi:hypothetical protein